MYKCVVWACGTRARIDGVTVALAAQHAQAYSTAHTRRCMPANEQKKRTEEKK